MNNRRIIGFTWSLVSAFLWGTTYVAGRFLIFNNYIDPITLSCIRFLIAGTILMGVGAIFYKDKIFKVSLFQVLYMAMLALFGMVSMSTLLLFGQRYTNATNSSLIMQLNPVLISFLGIFIGEKLKIHKIIGLIISFIGCLIVIQIITLSGISYSFNNNFGDVLVFLAALSWAIYSILSKGIVLKLGGYVTNTWIIVLAGIELIFIRLIVSTPIIIVNNFSSWLTILYIAIFPTAIAFFAWLEAMDKISLSLLNIMQYLTPFFSIVLGNILLGENFNISHFIGIIFILLGIYISEYYKKINFKNVARKIKHIEQQL